MAEEALAPNGLGDSGLLGYAAANPTYGLISQDWKEPVNLTCKQMFLFVNC